MQLLGLQRKAVFCKMIPWLLPRGSSSLSFSLFSLLQRVLSFLPPLVADDEVSMNWKSVSLEKDILQQRQMEEPGHVSVNRCGRRLMN